MLHMIKRLLSWLINITIAISALVGLLVIAVVGLIVAVFFSFGSHHFFEVDLEPSFSNNEVTKPYYIHLNIPNDLDSSMGSVFADQLLTNPADQLFDRYMIFESLMHAAVDKDVKGLKVTLQGNGISRSVMDEIALIVEDFKDHDKSTEIFVRERPTMASSAMALAAKFGSVYVDEHSFYGVTGYSIDVPFAAEFLKNIGINPQMGQRHEFKGGIDSLESNEMPAALKKNLGKLLSSLFNYFKQDIMQGRDIQAGIIDNVVEQAPISSEQIIDMKLADEIRSYDTWLENKAAESISALDYYRNSLLLEASGDENAARVAVIVIHGAIEPEGHSIDIDNVDSKAVLEQLKALKNSKQYDAVLMIIDSPGGEFKISWRIKEATKAISQAGIPVVALLADIAASGGYMIASAADEIVATRSTITGSIGVYGGKISIAPLMKKLGIHWQRIQQGKHAGLMSGFFDFTKSERKRLDAMLDNIYEQFASDVGVSRDLKADELDQAARGRIFTGADAHQLKLVDDLQGWRDSNNAIRKLAGIEEHRNIYFDHITSLNAIDQFIAQIARFDISQNILLNMPWPIASLSKQLSYSHQVNSTSVSMAMPPQYLIYAEMTPFIIH